jgi:hypothetical protein
LFLGRNESGQNAASPGIKYTIDGLDVTDLFVSDGQNKYNWSLIEINPLRVKHEPGNLYFSHTHIQLDRIFKYATEEQIKKMHEKAQLVCICKCQVTTKLG